MSAVSTFSPFLVGYIFITGIRMIFIHFYLKNKFLSFSLSKYRAVAQCLSFKQQLCDSFLDAIT